MSKNLNFKNIFEDREDAALKLLEILPVSKMRDEDWLIVALSPQSISMAEFLAKKLQLCYDILFTEAVYAPNNPNCEIAMVSENEEVVIHERLIDSFGIEIEYVYGEAHRKYEEKILKNVYSYRKGELISSLHKRNVLFIDEGCETGFTALIAIKTAMSSKVNSIIYATPLMPTDVATDLESVADEVYTVYHVANFVNTDFYYKQKKKLQKDELKGIVENSTYYLPFRKLQEQEN